MKFVKRGEHFDIVYKAHNSDPSLEPELLFINHDGTVLDRTIMAHVGDGLYKAQFTAPNEDTYIAAKVESTLGTIVVGKPKVTKIFYYDKNPKNTRFEFRDPDTLHVLLSGDMFPIGHDLYVITTTLDGDLQLIAGGRKAAVVMLPFRAENIPAGPTEIIAEYNKLDVVFGDRR